MTPSRKNEFDASVVMIDHLMWMIRRFGDKEDALHVKRALERLSRDADAIYREKKTLLQKCGK